MHLLLQLIALSAQLYFRSRLIKYSSPQCYRLGKPSINLSRCRIKTVKEVFLEEVCVAIFIWKHGIGVIRDASPSRGNEPREAWVYFLGGVIEAEVIRVFEEVCDTIYVSKTNERISSSGSKSKFLALHIRVCSSWFVLFGTRRKISKVKESTSFMLIRWKYTQIYILNRNATC